jgi:hypothetical protein
MRTEEAYTQAEESKRGTEEVMRAILEACAKSGTQETILEVKDALSFLLLSKSTRFVTVFGIKHVHTLCF